jgi:hypothetical protein
MPVAVVHLTYQLADSLGVKSHKTRGFSGIVKRFADGFAHLACIQRVKRGGFLLNQFGQTVQRLFPK